MDHGQEFVARMVRGPADPSDCSKYKQTVTFFHFFSLPGNFSKLCSV